jgi:hypothetical protein
MNELDPAARAELWQMLGDDVQQGCALLRDLSLAQRLLELAATIPEPIARMRTVAKAAHMVDVLLDHTEAVELPELMRQAVDGAAGSLRLALEGLR